MAQSTYEKCRSPEDALKFMEYFVLVMVEELEGSGLGLKFNLFPSLFLSSLLEKKLLCGLTV